MDRIQLWGILEDRAQQARERYRAKWAAASQTVARLEANVERIDAMYRDYEQRRISREADIHQVQSTQDLRHTQKQLIFLRRKLEQELQAARAERDQWAAQLQKAEQDHLKARTLQEKAQQAERQAQARADQRRMDALSLIHI